MFVVNVYKCLLEYEVQCKCTLTLFNFSCNFSAGLSQSLFERLVCLGVAPIRYVKLHVYVHVVCVLALAVNIV